MDLDGDAGVEGHVTELVPVREQRLHPQHVLLGSGVAEPLGDLGERLAHVLDSSLAGTPPAGSASKKRSAVFSKFRRLWAERRLSAQDLTSSASDWARVPAESVPMRVVGRLHLRAIEPS